MATSALCCPLWGCASNALWWSCLCRKWRRYGTTDKHSQFEQDRRRRAAKASSRGANKKAGLCIKNTFRCLGCGASDIGNKYGWLHKDPCGLFTASLTHFFICGASFIGTFHLLMPWATRHVNPLPPGAFWTCAVIFNSLLALGAVSHFRAMTTDPGAVPEGALPLPADFDRLRRRKQRPRQCQRSGVYKPPRAHFDSGVERQVVKMDHHCPWVNNCVGMNNQKFFILFCMYVGLASAFAIVMIGTFFLSRCDLGESVAVATVSAGTSNYAEGGAKPQGVRQLYVDVAACALEPGSTVLVFLLSFESLLFGLFTLCMFMDQMMSINLNKTYIDRLKDARDGSSGGSNGTTSADERYRINKNAQCMGGICAWLLRKDFFLHLREVVGDSHPLLWIVPTLPRWHNRDQLFGFTMAGSKLGRETRFRMLSNHDVEELPEEDPVAYGEWS